MRGISWLRFAVCLIICFVLVGCQNRCKEGRSEVSLACWNVQTFFDANNDGCEYSDFRKSKYWSKDAYIERLKRLADVIKRLDCDVFVLEEIENESVVMDVRNQLAGASWRASECWNYSYFAKEQGAAIGCAVISRLPLSDLRVHSMDVRTEDENQPALRPVMQVTVNSGEKQLVLFVNHWKSKSGGAEESEIWRNWQEALLVDRVISMEGEFGKEYAVIMCGDFNKDILEFEIDSDVAGSFMSPVLNGFGNGLTGTKRLKVYSPWISSDGSFATEIGSYYYKNEWERIDQIFSYGTASISDFQVCSDGPWATAEGFPVSYKIYSGQGYSDHLPLKCRVRF